MPGLMHPRFGRYRIRDIEFVAAFDVDAAKVGHRPARRDLGERNDTFRFAEVRRTGVTVQRGPTLDGLGEYYREVVRNPTLPSSMWQRHYAASGAQVLICYLPVGSEDAARFYAQAALDAGVAFVNALPVFIASDPVWAEKFRAAGRPDCRRRHQEPARRDDHPPCSRATLRGARPRARPHLPAQRRRQHGLQEHARAQAAAIQEDLQDPVGHEQYWRERSTPTTCTSARAITCRGCDDRKIAYVRLEGHGFGNAPTSLEYKLEVWDSPNSAGVVIDAIRAAGVALEAGIGGPLEAASAYFMKSPPVQYPDPSRARLLGALYRRQRRRGKPLAGTNRGHDRAERRELFGGVPDVVEIDLDRVRTDRHDGRAVGAVARDTVALAPATVTGL